MILRFARSMIVSKIVSMIVCSMIVNLFLEGSFKGKYRPEGAVVGLGRPTVFGRVFRATREISLGQIDLGLNYPY